MYLMDRCEFAWAAGFWDGEGSAYLTGALDRGTRQPQARVNQSSVSGIPEVLQRFQLAMGFGEVKGPDLREGKEPLYRWVVSNRPEVVKVLTLLRPWLGIVKRRQLANVLGLSANDDRPTPQARYEELAWAAGFFDGEGSTYLEKHRTHPGYFRLETGITQADARGIPFVLVEFQRIVGSGKIYGPYPAPEGQDPVYRWKAHRAGEIVAMIDTLRPWLGAVKRDQADRSITIVNGQRPLPRGNPAWGNRKTHCVRGHEYATARVRPFRWRGRNTEARRASKQCLACVREHARRKRLERKEKSRG